MIKTFEQFITENNEVSLMNSLLPMAVNGKYLYHYTLPEHLDSIKREGLIPSYEPNLEYGEHYGDKATEAVFLTNKDNPTYANLPYHLLEEFNDYDEGDDKPLVRLTVDISGLDESKFIYDDDYTFDHKKQNTATDHIGKVIDSIKLTGAIGYMDIIPASCIVGSDYEFYKK